MGESEALTRLLARWPENKINPSLSRVEQFLSALGNPENSFKSLHIAGTNGKTSTARMLQNILLELNLRVGLYTSPHLIHPRERIVVDAKPIDEQVFNELLVETEVILDLLELNHLDEKLTFFEAITAIAFQQFSQVPIDVGVIEVGLGGTWDATNVITPEVSVITPISLDHQDFLGDTIGEIAGEKAGILKANTPAVVALQRPEAEKVIKQRLADLAISAFWEGKDFSVVNRRLAHGGQVFDVHTPYAKHEAIFTQLYGEFQAQNAAVAITAAETFLGQEINHDFVITAFEKTTSPGRIEIIKRNPTVIIDAAHNPAGVLVSRKAIEESFDFSDIILILGCMKDKDINEMLSELRGFAAKIITTQVDSPRAIEHLVLSKLVEKILPESQLLASQSLTTALEVAIEYAKEKKGRGIVVLGSVALAGAVKDLL